MLKGAKLVNWLQDLFPEVAGAVGMGWARGVPGRVLGALRDRTLHSSHVTITTGSHMKRYLVSRGVPEDRLRVIHNWADGTLIRPIRSQDNALRREWGLDGKFVVGYSGNMGRVHEFQTILGAMEALKGDTGIVFLFIGGGAQRPRVEAQVRDRSLSNVRFLPYQPQERLAESLSAPDVHLISLRPEVEGFVVPSKFYGIAAAGRPTVFVGSTSGEIAQLVVDYQCGIAVRTGDIQGLAAAIRQLRTDEILRQKYGENAHRVFEERFERRIALAAWSEIL
jgi:glycosyltransferase involved in cell wall biosynthesis